jgi:hypothetical protein
VEAVRREREHEPRRGRGCAAGAELARVGERRRGAEHVGEEDEQVVLEERIPRREPDRQADERLADHVVAVGERQPRWVEGAGVEEMERIAEELLRDVARGPHEQERVVGDAVEGRRGVRQHGRRRPEDDGGERREAGEGGDDAAAHARGMVSNRGSVCYVAPRMRRPVRHASAR